MVAIVIGADGNHPIETVNTALVQARFCRRFDE